MKEYKVIYDCTVKYIEIFSANSPEDVIRFLKGVDSDGNPYPTLKTHVRQAVGQTVVGFDSIEKQVEKTDKINYNNDEIILQAHQNYHQKMEIYMMIIQYQDIYLSICFEMHHQVSHKYHCFLFLLI